MDDVTLSGPLFDGSAPRIVLRATEDIRSKVAAEGERLAAAALAGSIRHHGSGRAIHGVTTTSQSRAYQTGKYTLPVAVAEDETVVTTDLATYGPWLEGTGSRNETTRFKGYHSFRLATQALEVSAGELAEAAFQPYLRELQ